MIRNGFVFCLASAALALGGSAPALAQDPSDPAMEGFTAVQELQIVDCLLPGQVRSLGGRPYITPRRPTRTTAAECAQLGGEYLAYDRADYQSALNVWLEAAERGEPEAQNNVGEIYERGVGAEPDYEKAAEWYRKAAEQDYRRAQYNLGALYERGLGVPQDPLQALNWYRRSWGLEEDSLIWRRAAHEEQARVRAELEARIEQQERQIQAQYEQIEALRREREAGDVESAEAAARLEALEALVSQLEESRRSSQTELDSIPVAEEPEAQDGGSFLDRESRTYEQRDFGRYYALIIGVQDYLKLEQLESPLRDVERIGQVLEERYGFGVEVLSNPSQLDLMRAVNELNELLEPNDNLLIYFSGRGSRLQSGPTETGYWLPVNADRPPDDTQWVANDFVTRHLGRINARRVLVVSDSSYSDLLASEPGLLMVGEEQYGDGYIEYKLPKRSRLLLSSGTDEPVVGEDGGEHSIFARALLEELAGNDQVLTAPELFLRLRRRVEAMSGADDTNVEPDLKAIKAAGHEVGDFFLVPG